MPTDSQEAHEAALWIEWNKDASEDDFDTWRAKKLLRTVLDEVGSGYRVRLKSSTLYEIRSFLQNDKKKVTAPIREEDHGTP